MPLNYDFYNPFFAAAIVDTENRRFPLWSNLNISQDQLNAVGLGISSLPFLTELTVTMNLNYMTDIQATLEPPYRDAVAFMNSSVVEWGESRLECQFGYTGGDQESVLSPLFDGILLQPEIKTGKDVKLNLVARGSSAYSATYTEQTGISKTQSRRDWIRSFLKGPTDSTESPGRDIEVDFSEIEFGTDEYYLLEEKVSLSLSGYTDWRYLINMVRDCQCWCLIYDKKLHITPRSGWSKSPLKPKTFRIMDFPNGIISPLNGEFPILDWSNETPAAFYSGVRGLLLRDVNPKTRKVEDLLIADDLVKVARTGYGSGQPPKTKNHPGINPLSNNGATLATGRPTDTAQVALAKADFASNATQMGINITFETLGIPNLLPGEVITLLGLGLRFDGQYGVLSVKHTLNLGGYGSTVECVSNVGQLYDKFKTIEPFGKIAAPSSITNRNQSGLEWSAGATNGFDPIFSKRI